MVQCYMASVMCEKRAGDQNVLLNLKPVALSSCFISIVWCPSNVFIQRTTTATMVPLAVLPAELCKKLMEEAA